MGPPAAAERASDLLRLPQTPRPRTPTVSVYGNSISQFLPQSLYLKRGVGLNTDEAGGEPRKIAASRYDLCKGGVPAQQQLSPTCLDPASIDCALGLRVLTAHLASFEIMAHARIQNLHTRIDALKSRLTTVEGQVRLLDCTSAAAVAASKCAAVASEAVCRVSAKLGH